MVFAEFDGQISGGLQVTEYQRRLIQGYFIAIDQALKAAEERRLKQRRNQEPLPYAWENVNLPDLALDVAHYARMGLDMMQDNHLWPIPYKNNRANKYDITLMLGYGGIQYIAEKYALDKPAAVTVELVYETDRFVPIKKTRNSTEGYDFQITQPFDRGKVVGGFGYLEYADPAKNKLILMSLADILKRKPRYASPEFWGGEKDRWENGQVVGKEPVDGWFEAMCLKTIKREVYGPKHIPLDPQKVDTSYQHMRLREVQMEALTAQGEIIEHANAVELGPTAGPEPAAELGPPATPEPAEAPGPEPPAVPEPPAGPDGPDF
jgi:recombination protein RecT